MSTVDLDDAVVLSVKHSIRKFNDIQFDNLDNFMQEQKQERQQEKALKSRELETNTHPRTPGSQGVFTPVNTKHWTSPSSYGVFTPVNINQSIKPELKNIINPINVRNPTRPTKQINVSCPMTPESWDIINTRSTTPAPQVNISHLTTPESEDIFCPISRTSKSGESLAYETDASQCSSESPINSPCPGQKTSQKNIIDQNPSKKITSAPLGPTKIIPSNQRNQLTHAHGLSTEETTSRSQLSAAFEEWQNALSRRGFTINSNNRNETINGDEVEAFLRNFKVDGWFSTSIVTSLIFSFEWPPEHLVLHSSFLEHAESAEIPKSPPDWDLKSIHRTIIIPCCYRSHWTLFRIELDEQTVYHHDSLAKVTSSLEPKSKSVPLYSYLMKLLALQVPQYSEFEIKQGVSPL